MLVCLSQEHEILILGFSLIQSCAVENIFAIRMPDVTMKCVSVTMDYLVTESFRVKVDMCM